MTHPDTANIMIAYEGTPSFDKKTKKRIDILVEMRPLLDEAECTNDNQILLNVASECERVGLYYLAEKYRKRAGIHLPTPAEIKRDVIAHVVKFIEQKGCVDSKQIRMYLGQSRHEFEHTLSAIRKSPLITCYERKYYLKSDSLL
jgi:hypothetical protein